MTSFPFRQVDVFGDGPLAGNPVAVVHDAGTWDEQRMAAFARWTNLSETTFLLPATHPDADYRVRIWTPGGELPFAGHPTLGTAHAWLEAGGTPGREDVVVQECGVGLVEVSRTADGLAFVGPPLRRSGPVSPADRERIVRALRIRDTDVVDAAWVDNGPGWVGVRLADAAAVLAVDPDPAALGGLAVGVVGPYGPGEPDADVEVRAFIAEIGAAEDPVTGSLNAGLGEWLAGTVLPTAYVASQGTVLGRRGRVHVRRDGDVVRVGGSTVTTVRGEVTV
ncbi:MULTISPECIES: PhzF family phenazine biosynthesis protein [unclassified Isoptericola]|uniref:PhzF family phenazine biosynthesis protein n=1 Tax=unclassified Isoptericola TaxID=2623355 RepID=UPI0027136766|nr:MULTISPECIES: PhzF family phenazine biosynthesis protein [unclassified Isoptericola]MDO8145493.1 PhzF family phenazine biosynthesis protein [Isoptericola sp. 178]MDO8149134.1 PhzF family phenazine biosynthesis protein [Isoptericola sp. b515]MDO8150921.1 PhzF family phenazine biosynthesis protein [Isoptericola sp. b408]